MLPHRKSPVPSTPPSIPSTWRIVLADADGDPSEPEEPFAPAPPAAPSPEWTLYEFFVRWVLPERMSAASHLTRAEYEALLRPGGPWFWCTGDPPIRLIRPETLTHFFRVARRWPGRKPGSRVAAATLQKYQRELQRILLLAAPRSQCEQAATKRGMFGVDEDGDPIYAPRLAKLKVLPKLPRRDPNPFKVSELAQVLTYLESDRAKSEVTQPHVPDVEPREWWRSLWIVAYETAMRRGTLLAVEYGMVAHPDDGLCVLNLPPEIMKGAIAQTIVLSPEAQEAIERIRTPRTRIFPWTACKRHFDTVRRRILAAAGLPEHRRLGTHAVRKAFCTEAARINPAAAVKQAGHSAAVASQHYQGLALVQDCSRKMDRPRRAAPPKPADPRQRELPFETPAAADAAAEWTI